MSPSEFFIKEAVAVARRMSIPDARKYLSGMLELVEDKKAVDEVRSIFVLLDEASRQMDLITEPEIKSANKTGDHQ